MQDIQTFIVNGMYFIIDLATLFLVMASIAILVYAVTTMVKNRQPRWDNLLFIPAALFLFALGLQVLPPLFMKSARIGLADSRVEADVLREELRGWLPDAIPVPAGDAAEAEHPHEPVHPAIGARGRAVEGRVQDLPRPLGGARATHDSAAYHRSAR